ncbi:phenylacetate--CoA ligase family protein [Shewanella woodyi]|uniref:phenylacetate--CoA ligase family protein n=1 Tax=Shewanella woodyi TaxID=60961 RepID=UPI0007EB393D|nr:AMP-binding protein [Shewanella woodyi]
MALVNNSKTSCNTLGNHSHSNAAYGQYTQHLQLLNSYQSNFSISDDSIITQLNDAIRYATSYSPFYIDNASWHEIDSIEALQHLPFTSKEDVKNCYPFNLLAVDFSNIIRYGESTGTSGQYSSGFVTKNDWLSNNLEVCLSWGKILSNQDVLAVAVPYELTYVGADIDRVAEILNVTVVSIGTNNILCPWTRLVNLIKTYSITTLFCSPTRAIRLAQLATEAGLDPKNSTVNKIICVGEPSSSAKQKFIAESWNAKVYNHYGMTEALAVATPCEKQKLHLCSNRLFSETLSPKTGYPVPLGEMGELVFTTLNTEAMPLIRYKTGDLIRLDHEPCSCGNPHPTFTHLGREDDIFEAPDGVHHFSELDTVLFSIQGLEPYFSYTVTDNQTLSISAFHTQTNTEDKSLTAERIRTEIRRTFDIEANVSVSNNNEMLEIIDNCSKPGTAIPSSPLMSQQ